MPSLPFDSLKAGEPAWRVALFYPQQGGWTETDYLELEGGPLVEYDDGFVEVLDTPTKEHQRVVQYLFLLLQQYVNTLRCGEVFIAPLPVRLWPRKFREPDVVFVRESRGEYCGYPEGADLVMEVVSPGAESRRRDTETKVQEYARAGIAEYWIIDPERHSISVHGLVGESYARVTCFLNGQQAKSELLTGFCVSVDEVLAAARGR